MGTNILQFLAVTPNINYTSDIKPFLSITGEIGYSFNHIKAEDFDFVSNRLTAKNDYDDGYYVDSQTGWYEKAGFLVNIRRNYERNHFPQIGAYYIHSAVKETGLHHPLYLSTPIDWTKKVTQTTNINSLSVSVGYYFKITKKLGTGLHYQTSLADIRQLNLMGYRNFVPGMGYKANTKSNYPMLIWRIQFYVF